MTQNHKPMKLSEFKKNLDQHAQNNLAFILPGGNSIPSHAHITEVGYTQKTFLDCGGKLRRTAFCSLQIWVADDIDHRLPASKLAAIIEKAEGLLGTDDLEIQVECQEGSISLFSVGGVESVGGTLAFTLTPKQTACLAMAVCRPHKEEQVENESCCCSSDCCQ
jgi:hypothetical protein